MKAMAYIRQVLIFKQIYFFNFDFWPRVRDPGLPPYIIFSIFYVENFLNSWNFFLRTRGICDINLEKLREKSQGGLLEGLMALIQF